MASVLLGLERDDPMDFNCASDITRCLVWGGHANRVRSCTCASRARAVTRGRHRGSSPWEAVRDTHGGGDAQRSATTQRDHHAHNYRYAGGDTTPGGVTRGFTVHHSSLRFITLTPRPQPGNSHHIRIAIRERELSRRARTDGHGRRRPHRSASPPAPPPVQATPCLCIKCRWRCNRQKGIAFSYLPCFS